MPLSALVLAVVVQAVVLHSISHIFLKKEADGHYGTAIFAGLATFMVFNGRDGLSWWPALPLLVSVGLLAHYLSVKAHRRWGR
jgi:hypothetical protein